MTTPNAKHILRLLCAVLAFLPLAMHAQERKQQVRTDSVPSAEQFATPMQQGMSTGIAPATDFAPDPLIVKMMQINPLAVKVPPMKLPYLAKWDKGGILGFSGDFGTYLGRYQGVDISYGKFGMMVGVQQGFMPYAGRWEVMPLAMPYYKIGNARIGVDIGGMLYNALGDDVPTPGNPLGVKNYHGTGIIAPQIDTKPKFKTLEVPQWMEKQFDQPQK